MQFAFDMNPTKQNNTHIHTQRDKYYYVKYYYVSHLLFTNMSKNNRQWTITQEIFLRMFTDIEQKESIIP